MPFWKKDSGKPKEKTNYKARLEHKQYLVRIFSDVFILISGLNISYIFSSISLIQQYVSWPYSHSPRGAGGVISGNKNFSFLLISSISENPRFVNLKIPISWKIIHAFVTHR